MRPGIMLICALLLSFERATYYLASQHPRLWRRLCLRSRLALFSDPVKALENLFYGFKFLQLGVFWSWCSLMEHTLLPLPTAPVSGLFAGAGLIALGQLLNFSVFRRLGNVGVFYGAQFDYSVPWVSGFPFSLFRHPQYLGALLSIWGFFVVMRFPNIDWIYIPLLETVYYAWGAYHEP